MDYLKKAKEYEERIIESIGRVVAIKSVMEEPLEGKPFGQGPADALAEFLLIGSQLGFKSVNLDNYAGYIEMGQGEELVGIIGHVDVVPEGIGWDTDPYTLTVKDNVLYARGVTDDKGPAMMALYAMKIIKDSGLPINKRVRLVLGANEETGMECIKHYKQIITEQFSCGFTPDAEFPLIFGEKGSYHANFSAKLKRNGKDVNLKEISGGDAVNVVCNKCIATLSGSKEALEDVALRFNEFYKQHALTGCTISEQNELSLVLNGVGAHASMPELGRNAISYMAEFLGGVVDEPFITGYNKLIGLDLNARNCGAFLEDKYGMLTFNVGIIKTEEDTVCATIDIRYPITLDFTATAQRMKENFNANGLNIEKDNIGPSLFIDPDSDLIRLLFDAYVSVTGDDSLKPFTIGGGTYAKAFANIVAFGPEYPGHDYNIHMANECYSVDEMVKSTAIYAYSIEKLLSM